MVHE